MEKLDTDALRVKPYDRIRLSMLDPKRPEKFSKDALKDILARNTARMCELQERLYAESKRSLLIILQAIDAGGKDGTINTVFAPLNPQGVSVTSFKAPSALELSHDFLWRIHRETPGRGEIRIFNRSQYEDVLIVRVHGLIDKKECERRFDHINAFERLLTDCGTRIVKLFLYISKDEQKKRLQERIDIRAKNWKFDTGDLAERKRWDDYIAQFEAVFSATSTKHAPWYIIPANSNSYRNALVSQIVRDTLTDMDPEFPPPEKGIRSIVIR